MIMKGSVVWGPLFMRLNLDGARCGEPPTGFAAVAIARRPQVDARIAPAI